MMKLVSWNVNGLRACDGKGFRDVFRELDADVFCVQETKLQPGQLEMSFPGYESFWHSAEKRGYSGTAVFTRPKPLAVGYGIEAIPEAPDGQSPLLQAKVGGIGMDNEGRVITLELDDLYVVCCYTPNSQDGLRRLDYRMEWEEAFRRYLLRLDERKPVVLCGDLNVAHEEIDLKNPATNHHNAGFSDEERAQFTALLEAGFTDTFRWKYPDVVRYSWWSYRFQARQKGIGWRIDYFVASNRLQPRIDDAKIHSDILGSDHCPVELTLL